MPALHVGRGEVLIEEADALPQIRTEPAGGPERGNQAIRERVRQRRNEVLSVIEGRDHLGRLAEPGLDDVKIRHAIGLEVNSNSGPEDGCRRE